MQKLDWRFDHIGVVVKSLAAGRRHFRESLMIDEWTSEFTDPVNGVCVQFGRDIGGTVYELISPIDDSSPIHAALQGRKNLLNHVAYRVADLATSAAHLRNSRCAPAGEAKPAVAYCGALIQFFVTPIGTIIELIEAIDHAHLFARSEQIQ